MTHPKDLVSLANGPGWFTKMWSEVCQEAQFKQDAWIAELRSHGVKAAHPDDGCIDREKSKMQFAYPQFNDGAISGDMVALGTYDSWRLVRLISSHVSIFCYKTTWKFEPKK